MVLLFFFSPFTTIHQLAIIVFNFVFVAGDCHRMFSFLPAAQLAMNGWMDAPIADERTIALVEQWNHSIAYQVIQKKDSWMKS